MKITRLLIIVLTVLLTQAQSLAWSGPGHAAVAAMAYRELAANPALRNNLTNLLKSHPKFSAWKSEFNAIKSSLPSDLDLGMFLFIRASTWPDEIRRTTVPALKPFDHPNWHFVDYPLNPPSFSTGPSPTPDDDILFGLRESMETLGNAGAAAKERAAALSWVIHLVGDIHQPLHCASLITAAFPAPEGDRGGNSFLVFQTAAQKSSGTTTKLHSFWDGRLGTTTPPKPIVALQDAKMLKSLHSRVSLSELGAGDDTEKWSFESRDSSIGNVYKFQNVMIKQNKVVPNGYITNSHTVARRRLALAGYRLADELKKVVF